MTERLDHLRALLRENRLDAFVVTPSPTLRYLTGTPFNLNERLFMLLVPARGEPVTVLSDLEVEKWRDSVPFAARLFPWQDASGPERALADAVATLSPPVETIGVEPLALRYMEYTKLQAQLPKAKLRAADAVAEQLRLVKDAAEVDALRRAIAITEEALTELLPTLRVGESERVVAARLTALLLGKGGEGLPFGPIVLSGPKSALPHGEPDERRLGEGELLLLDFGTTVDGYCSDITRTFVVGAEPEARIREVYQAVAAANAAGRAAARPGLSAHELHHATQDDLSVPAFADFFKHRTGHGLGLDIHEPPSIMDGNQERLVPGTVFTIEPGLYLTGWGGVRIEDDVLITADGVDSLTSFGRELQVVGKG